MLNLDYIKRIVEEFKNSKKTIDSLEVCSWLGKIRITRGYSKKIDESEIYFHNTEKDSVTEQSGINESLIIEYVCAPVSGILHYHPNYSPDHAIGLKITPRTVLGAIDKKDNESSHKDLRSKITGTIEKFLVIDGERVEKSQLLIKVSLDKGVKKT